jgi:hypothetical protein
MEIASSGATEGRSPGQGGQGGSPAAGPVVSVVVPVTDRPDPLVELYREHAAPLRDAGYQFEFVFVTDVSHKPYTADLFPLSDAGEPVSVYAVGQMSSEGALVAAAAAKCRGSIIVTLPGRRVMADGIPLLVSKIVEGADMAVARRWPRLDSWLNRIQTRIFHWLMRGLSRSPLDDIASGVQAMRKEVLAAMPMQGDLYRFLPIAALREGYWVEQVEVAQHPRERRARLYGPGTYLRRLIDILGVVFLLRFTEKPLRFFGLIGSTTSMLGVAILALIVVQRMLGEPMADRPLLLLGTLLIVLGVQFIALGLVGEIIVHVRSHAWRPYRLQADTRVSGTDADGTDADPSIAEPEQR